MNLADDVRLVSDEEELEPGLVCALCDNVWNRVKRLRGLADLDCPGCGAMYVHVGRNREP